MEIGYTVFEDWYGASAYLGSCLDNGGAAAFVHGAPIRDWQTIYLPNARMGLHLNGTFIKSGFGRAAMGHPVTSLTWLANWLRERGLGLSAGEISLSSIPAIMAAAVGDSVGGRLAPAALGFITLIFGVGQSLGPAVAGWIKDATGTFAWAFILSAGVSLMGAAGAMLLRKKASPSKNGEGQPENFLD